MGRIVMARSRACDNGAAVVPVAGKMFAIGERGIMWDT